MPSTPGARHAVLITRPLPEAEATAARLRALGWTPIVAPVLTIEPSPPLTAFPVDGLVVTSANALPALTGFTASPLLAIGDATASKARQAGFLQVSSAAGDAQAVAALAPHHFPAGATLLLPTTGDEGLALAAALQAQGFRVERRLAYTVTPARALPEAAVAALRADILHAALFLSARTACSFAALLSPALHPHLAGIEALAIGQPAADRLTPLPWRRVRVSLAPTLDQVLALL